MEWIGGRNPACLPADGEALIFQDGQGRVRRMKAILAILMFALCVLQVAAGEHALLYARVTVNLNATLPDGSIWQIDKGDCFPVIAYKESHTKLILRLASNQFIIPGDAAVIVSEKETPAAIENYKTAVNSYINGVAMRWRAKAEATPRK